MKTVLIQVFADDAEAFEKMAKAQGQDVADFFKLILREIKWREQQTIQAVHDMDEKLTGEEV